jgi:hypothetical protein
MGGLELLWRVWVIRLSLCDLLGWLLLPLRELADGFVNAKSLVGVRRKERFIMRVRVQLLLLLSLGRNGNILTVDLQIWVEEVLKLGLGALREGLILELGLVVLQFFQCNFMGCVVLIGLVLLDAVERGVLVELARLAGVRQEILGSHEDITFLVPEILLDVNAIGLMRVGGLDLLPHNLGGHEHLIMHGLDLLRIGLAPKVNH